MFCVLSCSRASFAKRARKHKMNTTWPTNPTSNWCFDELLEHVRRFLLRREVFRVHSEPLERFSLHVRRRWLVVHRPRELVEENVREIMSVARTSLILAWDWVSCVDFRVKFFTPESYHVNAYNEPLFGFWLSALNSAAVNHVQVSMTKAERAEHLEAELKLCTFYVVEERKHLQVKRWCHQ